MIRNPAEWRQPFKSVAFISWKVPLAWVIDVDSPNVLYAFKISPSFLQFRTRLLERLKDLQSRRCVLLFWKQMKKTIRESRVASSSQYVMNQDGKLYTKIKKRNPISPLWTREYNWIGVRKLRRFDYTIPSSPHAVHDFCWQWDILDVLASRGIPIKVVTNFSHKYTYERIWSYWKKPLPRWLNLWLALPTSLKLIFSSYHIGRTT